MPRRKPFSAKQKKAQLQEKRAIKRGDLPAPTTAELNAKKSKRSRKPGASMENEATRRTRMLISSFLKPSSEFLEASKKAAAVEPLFRPIPESSRILNFENVDQGLVCPRRPRWRYEMTKKEVEKNEEGLFAKWTKQTDEIIDAWRETNAVSGSNAGSRILPAPTYYERNIEVWRQLWRVCELSSILMLLLDARCPPLHYPPSLDAYIKSLRPARQVVLVLTKIDIIGEGCASAWRSWLEERHKDAGVQVVGIQSYEQVSYGEGQGSRIKHQSHLPISLRDELRDALKRAHEALLEPPQRVKEDPEKLAKWKPAVRTHVDWNAMGRDRDTEPAFDDSVVKDNINGDSPGPEVPADETDEDTPSREYLEDRFLTIGLIGQPNVGKSSLLNALFGEHKVKASRTPGKTKHFQTLFLTPEIRLVDCPGLVLPALVPMELQVLSNVLPIAQIPALPACIRFAGNLMPIEKIFGVDRSLLEAEEVIEDKRTWREGMRPVRPIPEAPDEKWTALQVMSAYATKRGWKTAKAGRPDSMRAGNAMMRTIVEGRVSWAFWPPGSNPLASNDGIWLQGRLELHDDDDVQSSDGERSIVDSRSDASTPGEPLDEEHIEGDEESHNESKVETTSGRFAALGFTDGNDEESD